MTGQHPSEPPSVDDPMLRAMDDLMEWDAAGRPEADIETEAGMLPPGIQWGDPSGLTGGDIAAAIDRLFDKALADGFDRNKLLWPLIYAYRAAGEQKQAGAQRDRLRAALAFIADWAHDCIDGPDGKVDTFYGFDDIEQRARAALTDEPEGKP